MCSSSRFTTTMAPILFRSWKFSLLSRACFLLFLVIHMPEFVSNKLHAALFNCLSNLFSSWHFQSSDWAKTSPIIMMEKIEKLTF
uniref:Uncharacterized protein n=1 Tax=Aegilops tauschii subsp. strangulata TaxID=200361 RepID=A0A453QV58_AEGTS